MIDIKNIYKYFDKQKVLNGVNCTINKGEKVVIIGASGSGKSTLLRCMNLLTEPTYGEVWMEGKLLTPVDPYLHSEIIELSKHYSQILPCIDFAHIHAREDGKFNTYDEFCYILEHLGQELGEVALNNFHGHVAGIDYNSKGEKKHLIFEEADFNYKDLMRAFKKFDIKGAIVCESPNIEIDTKILKEYYTSL